MKYKCDVIRDLMPLCADDSAAAGSRKIVYEHMSECRDCENYYNEVIHEIHLDRDWEDTAAAEDKATAEYTVIAKRFRRRKQRCRVIISILVAAAFLLLLNYALGFRLTALEAAERSGRLNKTSQVIGTYDWGDVQFFFYESAGNYDTIASVRHINGWRSDDFYFVWPKYPADKDSIIITSALNFYRKDKGIFVLPVLCKDEEVARITVTAFGKTKSADLQTGALSVLAFENNDLSMEEDTVGYAYDRKGDIKYELKFDDAMARWVWELKS